MNTRYSKASSGDDGVDGEGFFSCPPFRPTYLGACPFILSVGATQNFSPESMVDTALAGFWSSAGFSNYFLAPSYQSTQTAAYVTSLNGQNKGDFNVSGRAFPDISAQGSFQPVVVSGAVETVRLIFFLFADSGKLTNSCTTLHV